MISAFFSDFIGKLWDGAWQTWGDVDQIWSGVDLIWARLDQIWTGSMKCKVFGGKLRRFRQTSVFF